MNEHPVLIVREGELVGQQWSLDTPEVIIGRGHECQIVLPERQVSRHHVRIVNDDKGFVLYDLSSKNGTHLNGQKISDDPIRLKDGDEIQIKEKSRQIPAVMEAVQKQEREVPGYVDADASKHSAKYLRTAGFLDIPYPVKMEPNLVIEYYSR